MKLLYQKAGLSSKLSSIINKVIILLILTASLSLSSCGKKGDLYLEEEKQIKGNDNL